ncbi:UDP-2,3-diacylglucosamine hydrolase [Sulfuritortus calidifontis]|uniref:UDP-2,3-diacylglucosamine hydrolase n=1 Tax=Sulfuritortus calidifontis TaxID=1914471 RepID=A0A4R3JX15_9PROT|nr:UDP-2,3-diacylglucosamine diphosphatase [Sulfuritortus calidifontis]TCS72930.1 UDP-2,3-diacylglucosamine hydrolase [Sulfuritortus calidifontis]
MPDTGHSLFISDLHLSPELPQAVALFRRFLQETAARAQALYILGDFFEAWVGDDDLALPFHAGIAHDLKRLAERGVRLYLMHGNRDFLLGEAFCRASGATLLADPSLIDLYGSPTLLAHGDRFCTDDAAYQAFRRQVREPAWQAGFLAKPLAERREMARQMRAQSEREKAAKEMALMDVNPEAVAAALREHGYPRLIHGHTHRPARHLHEIDGHLCERWVLPDWYEGGGYLRCDADGCNACSLG